MSDAIVRSAAPADMESVGRLRWKWVLEEQAGTSDLSRDEFVGELTRWAEAHASTHECVVAEAGGKVVGMAWPALTARVPGPRSVDRWVGDLQSVYVLPEFRGQGIGSRLVELAIDRLAARGAERVTVHSSEKAVALYARAGLSASELLLGRPLNAS